MRYLVSMIFALAGLMVAVLYLSSEVASWVVAQQSFDSPDAAGSMHMLAFIATNFAALVVGWIVGWIVATPFAGDGAG
ncbi:hypothetical protein [Hyphomicrobium sp.]|uniref:hypothetical protein n=1 Tax=Hyphomicrobium sp. TaxID=82 RepID=UPI002CA531B2|nr:hypothetical protein [Hyphomicrobium sp.]HRN87194.1 hypothetical protein [Hyphomicrobium sp.]HRQ25816.1 hypothetical protein [Hyphomicrobium sp.]